MKVCFIAGTLERGGAERQLVFMLAALVEAGIEVKVLSLTSGEGLEKDIRALGIEVEWIGGSGNRLSRLIRITRSIRRYHPDIIQSAHFYTNLYAAVAGRILGIPSIGAIRNNLDSEIGSDRIFGKLQFSLPLALIANSEPARRRAEELDRRARLIELVRNAVDLPDPPMNDDTRLNRASTIIFVGRLVRQKRPEVFVKLADRLIKELPGSDLHFKLIGEGPLLSRLENMLADMNGSRRRIQFLGERSQMSQIYRHADILVSTSSFEGTPNVILEAMAHGVPVVATRVGGVGELLADDRGMATEPGDLNALTEALKTLIQDAGRRADFARKGRSYVSEYHSRRNLRERLPQIYERVVRSLETND